MYQSQDQQQTFLQQAASELRTILLLKDIQFTELLAGLMAMCWGAWLLNPAWSTFDSSPSFRAMAQLAPEWLWGLALVALGMTQIIGLLFESYPTRRIASATGILAWAFIGVTFGLANPASTATVIYPLLALSQVWCHIRLRVARL